MKQRGRDKEPGTLSQIETRGWFLRFVLILLGSECRRDNP
mgnify:CR=1 FL=1